MNHTFVGLFGGMIILFMFISTEFSCFTHDTQAHLFCKIFRFSGLVAKLYLTLEIWTVACPAPLSKEFFRQEYWSGLPFPFPGDIPDPGIKPRSPALQADSLPTELPGLCSIQGCVQPLPCVTTEHLKCGKFEFRRALCVNAQWILET